MSHICDRTTIPVKLFDRDYSSNIIGGSLMIVSYAFHAMPPRCDSGSLVRQLGNVIGHTVDGWLDFSCELIVS